MISIEYRKKVRFYWSKKINTPEHYPLHCLKRIGIEFPENILMKMFYDLYTDNFKKRGFWNHYTFQSKPKKHFVNIRNRYFIFLLKPNENIVSRMFSVNKRKDIGKYLSLFQNYNFVVYYSTSYRTRLYTNKNGYILKIKEKEYKKVKI